MTPLAVLEKGGKRVRFFSVKEKSRRRRGGERPKRNRAGRDKICFRRKKGNRQGREIFVLAKKDGRKNFFKKKPLEPENRATVGKINNAAKRGRKKGRREGKRRSRKTKLT